MNSTPFPARPGDVVALTGAGAPYHAVDLHIHDLRREFACSMLESGAALHDVQAFLGHANITTTSRYLQSALVRLEQALTRMEAAAGCAHHAHTHDSAAPLEAQNPTVETVSYSLN
jgi:hypothetical protein